MNQRLDPDARSRPWHERFPRGLPLAIFLLILAITLVSVAGIENTEARRRSAQLSQSAQVIASALERRANVNAAYLRSGAAVFSTQQAVARPVFQTYVSQLRLDTDYRGGEGIGWAMRVDKAEIPLAEAGMRRFGYRNFKIHPLPAEDQAYAVPVTYQQPETDGNRRALGYNMFAEPVRRRAMLEAQRFDRPTASGKVTLVEADPAANVAGFLVFMPVFGRSGAAGTRELMGFVYSPFNAQEFLASALRHESVGEIGVSLYDRAPRPENLLARIEVENPSGAVHDKILTVANHPWVLKVEAAKPSMLSPLSVATLLFGLLVATLLLVTARLLTRQALEDRLALAWFEEQASIRNSLTRELNHRVKNTLANVLSIVSLTRRRAVDLDSFASSLEGRIRALSATHDLLTQSEWGTTPVRAVVTAEMAPYVQDSEKSLDLAGPAVELAPNDALSLGLAIHELATNAAKYGALSVLGGRVAVTWQLLTQDLARVEWSESGGPPVAQEARKRGFGTELIEKIVAHELQNPVDLRFEPGGVRCTLIIPVRRPSEFAMRAPRK